jgi:antitoxin ParD1/3/4
MLLFLHINKEHIHMSNAEKISITMTPEMMKIIRASVEAGEYASISEVLRDAVRKWHKDREADGYDNWYRVQVQQGLDAVLRGEVLSFEEAEVDFANMLQGA